MSTGSGTSGNTGWSNSVRSRSYMERITAEGLEADPLMRKLTLMKSNYGTAGETIFVRWEAGRFVVIESQSRGAKTQAADVDALFLQLLAEVTSQGRTVTDKPGPTAAWSTFSKMPDGVGMKGAFRSAMERLLRVGKIKVVEFGRASKLRSKLVIVGADSGEDEACDAQ